MSTLVVALHQFEAREVALTGRVACDTAIPEFCTLCEVVILCDTGTYTWHDPYGSTICDECARPRRLTEPHVLGVDDV